MKAAAIILAAGSSSRMGMDKVLLKLGDKTVLEHCLERFELSKVSEIIIVANDTPKLKEIAGRFCKVTKVVSGSSHRQGSSFNGIRAAKGADYVLIHDCARPFVSVSLIDRALEDAVKHGASCPAIRSKHTIKIVKDDFAFKTLDRDDCFIVQTPQCFRYADIYDCHSKAPSESFTDDASIMEYFGHKVKITCGEETNIKLTTPEDILLAENMLFPRKALVGIGRDSHKFDSSGTLVLGGIRIEGFPKLLANSDGDVILHALFNAISTAIGMRSIGCYADEMCASGIKDSKEYIRLILDKAEAYARNFRCRGALKINNISISLECKRPKIEKYSNLIRESLSQIFDVPVEKIGIGATSGEGLTEFGKGNGILADAAVTLI